MFSFLFVARQCMPMQLEIMITQWYSCVICVLTCLEVLVDSWFLFYTTFCSIFATSIDRKKNSWTSKERTTSLLQILDHIDHCPYIARISKERLKFLNQLFKSSGNGANHTNTYQQGSDESNSTQHFLGSWFKWTPLSTQLMLYNSTHS